MPVVTRFPTTDTAVSGTWTSPTSAQAADGVVTSTTFSTGLTTVERAQGGYGFDALVPASALINSVTVEVRHRVSTTLGVALLENVALISGVAGSVNSDTEEPVTLITRTYQVTRPGGGSWTRADLLDAVFTTRLRARTGADLVDSRVTETLDIRITEGGDFRISEESVEFGTSVTFEWDYVSVSVDYTDTALQVALMQGSVIVASRFLDALTASATDYSFVLTSAERAAITDASALTLVFTAGAIGQQVTAVRLDLTGDAIVTADTTPPTVVSFSPAAGGVNATVAGAIVVEFSEPVQRGTGNIILRTATNQTVETFAAATSPRISISGAVVTVDPTATLEYGTTYYLDIPSGAVRDLATNAYAGTSLYSFTTEADTVGPVVLAYDPVVNGTNVQANANISLTFSKAVRRGTGTIVLRTSSGTQVETFDAASSSRMTIVNNVLTIDPTASLAFNFTYFLDIPSGAITDLVFVPYAGTSTYAFSSASQTVSLVSTVPSFDAVDVAVDANLALTFNTDVQRGTGVIALYAAPNQLVETFNVASSNRISISGSVVTIDPTNSLQLSRLYTLNIPSGAIRDLAGAAYAGTTAYAFSTPIVPGVEVWMPGSIPQKGFWVAMATSAHARSAVTVELDPAPTRVDYPTAPLGEMIETADGRVIMQQPTKDPRRRGWIWANFGPSIVTYERQFRFLEGLRSRYRQQSGQSPYIYVYDGTTELMNKRNTITRTVTSITTLSGERKILNVADMSASVHSTVLTNATVDLYVGTETSATQRVSITAATNTAITCTQVVDASVTGTVTAKISWLEPNWWRVRVLDTTRTPLESGNMRYAESKFVFVIEDPDWTEVG